MMVTVRPNAMMAILVLLIPWWAAILRVVALVVLSRLFLVSVAMAAVLQAVLRAKTLTARHCAVMVISTRVRAVTVTVLRAV